MRLRSIRERRLRLGLTQTELAHLAGLMPNGQPLLSRAEKGNRGCHAVRPIRLALIRLEREKGWIFRKSWRPR